MKKLLCSLLAVLLIFTILPVGLSLGIHTAQAASGPYIAKIAAGATHSLALISDGRLYVWGYDGWGQLGYTEEFDQNKPYKLGTGYTAVAGGEQHTLALKGKVLYAWGKNSSGQLGDGTYSYKEKPVKIGTGYTAISAGADHSLALKGKDLYAWGYNGYGQVGDGAHYTEDMDVNSPVKIGTGYTAVSAGSNHNLALKGRDLYAWGYNACGQVGNGTEDDQDRPVKIGTGYTAIAAGDGHSLALKGTTLYAWGANESGQLGDGTNISKNKPVRIGTGFTAIAAGSGYSLALKGNVLYSWGSNRDGELGNGTYEEKNKPVQIGTGYTAIAAGESHVLALKGNVLYSWGWNRDGQLGNGTYDDHIIPKKVPFPDLKIYLAKSVSLNKTKLSVMVGDIQTLKATVSPAKADQEVTWASSNKKIATVSSTGEVKGIKPGTVTITAQTSNGKKAKCTVKVTPIKVISIKLNESKLTLDKGATYKLSATISPGNAGNKKVKWKSSNKKIATVDSTGKVKGVSKGTATITATSEDNPKLKASCKVTVQYGTVYRALLIGNENYAHSTRLPGISNIRLFETTLKASTINGRKYERIVLKSNVTRKGLESQIKAMKKWGIDNNDVTVFLYSGHGNGQDNRSYNEKYASLWCVDEQGLNIPALKNLLDEIPGTIIVLLDCCYSGKAVGKSVGSNSDAKAFNDAVITSFSKDDQVKGLNTKKYHVLTASAGHELGLAWIDEDPELFVMSRFVMETGGYILGASRIGALKNDRDNDGLISVSEAYAYAKPLVRQVGLECVDQFGTPCPIEVNMQIYPENSNLPLFGRK